MAEVASAYVSLLPSFRGGASAISKELDGPAKKAGEGGGKKYGTGMAAGIGGMAKKVFAPLAAAAGGLALGSFFKDAIGAASDLEQSVGGVEAIFKDTSGTVEAFAKDAAGNLGLSQNSYNELAAIIGTTLKNSGTSMGELAGETDHLIGISADLAATFGGPVTDASGAMASALRGEFEPLRRYGVSLDQASINARALADSGKASASELTKQEKAVATQALIMEQSADAAGAFARESNTLAGQQERARAQFENLKTTLGTALLPAMSGVMGFVTGTMLPGIEGLIGFVTNDAIPAFQNLAGWIQDNQAPITVVAGVITAIFLPAMARMGIAAVVNAAKVVGAWIATQAAAIAGAAAQWGAVLRTVAGWVLMGAQSLIQAARMAAAWVIAMGPVGWVIAAVVALVALIIANWDTIVEWTKKAWTAVTEWLSNAWENIKNGVTTAWNAILDFFKAIPGKVVAFFMNWTLIGLLIKHWDSIKSTAIRVWTSIVDWVKGIPGRILNALSSIGRLYIQFGLWVLSMKDAAVDKFVELVNYVKTIPGKIVDGLGNLSRKLISAGKDLLGGLIQGIKDKVAGAVTAVKDAVGSVISGAKNALGINSPSRVFMEIGEQTGEGLKVGLERSQSATTAAMRDLVKPPNLPDMRSNLSLARAGGASSSGPTVQQTNHITNPDPGAVLGVISARLGSAMAGAR